MADYGGDVYSLKMKFYEKMFLFFRLFINPLLHIGSSNNYIIIKPFVFISIFFLQLLSLSCAPVVLAALM